MESQAIIIKQQGAPSVMRLERVLLGPLGVGEARVRQSAIGINFMDVYQLGDILENHIN